MKATVKLNGRVDVEWNCRHFGHECEINFLKLTATERAEIENKLKNGISFDRILDDIRDSVYDDTQLTRLHLLDKRDLWNLLRKVDFKKNHAHDNDAISVDILVESLKKRGEKDPVLFYKPQDRPCTCTDPDCTLDDSDFMIILSTDYQRKHLTHYLKDKVLIDSTHGTKSYDFQLTTLGSVDEAGVGVPVAFCVSNRVSEESMGHFFRVFRDKVCHIKSTKVFMSDMATDFSNAWKSVMGHCDNTLYCTWHVDNRWQQKVKEKVKGLHKQLEMYRALLTVRNILDREWFEICLEGFRNMLQEDPDTEPFLPYFESYVKTKEKWAYCYRLGLGLNTNMFMEAMFKKLKYSYMKGKKLRRVDECLSILMRYARDIAFERLRRVCKG